jgi:hypothetical protein
MLLDDALERGSVAAPIPRALRIDDGDRTAFADPQAVRLRTQNATGLRQPELPEARLEILPRLEPTLAIATLRVRLIGAEKYVASRVEHADRRRDILEALQFVC